MEASLSVKYTVAQVALARLWVGDLADPNMPTKVMVKVPEPTAEDIVLSDKSQVQMDKYPLLPCSYREAESVIKCFEQGAEVLVGDSMRPSLIQLHSMRSKTKQSLQTNNGWEARKWSSICAYCSDSMAFPVSISHPPDRYVSELSYRPRIHLLNSALGCTTHTHSITLLVLPTIDSISSHSQIPEPHWASLALAVNVALSLTCYVDWNSR